MAKKGAGYISEKVVGPLLERIKGVGLILDIRFPPFQLY
jgi:hypothetical protein